MGAVLPDLYRRLADIFEELDAAGFEEDLDFGSAPDTVSCWYFSHRAYQYLHHHDRLKELLSQIGQIGMLQELDESEGTTLNIIYQSSWKKLEAAPLLSSTSTEEDLLDDWGIDEEPEED